MTIEDIIKANGGMVAKRSDESTDANAKSTSRISEIIAANKETADKQLTASNAPKAHGGATDKFGVDTKGGDGTVKIHALGAGETKPTTSRVGKTINAGVQGTMSNFTNFWGWLKESDAAARARDEADKEYTERQNKQLAETKGEKAIAKTEKQQKQKYAENHAKQKDNWSKDYEEADKLSAMSEKNVAEAKDGLGKVGQALVDIGVVGTQMLGDAVLNIIPGGGTASMIARVAGGAAQQARLEGKDIGQQSLSAIKSGGIAWLTEKMFGAFGKLYGKGAADDAVEAIVRRIGKTNAGKNFLRLGLNALGEGAEEITEDLLNAAADRALKLGDGELDLGEVLYDGFLGFALGGLGTGVQILNAQKVLAKTVAENAADPEMVKTAEAMTQKLNDGEMLTTAEAETLAGALEASTSVEEAAETVQQGEVTPNEEKPLTPVEAVTRVAKGKVSNESEQLNIDNTGEQLEALQNRDEVLAQQQSNLPEGMGAASAEFTGEMSPAEKWVAEAQGKGDNAVHDISAEAMANLARQQHRAPQDVPKYDKDGRLTRAGVEAIINSGFTDNAFAQRMLEETFEGAASYSQFSDKTALRKAKADIKKQGYAEAVAKYLSDSFNGKVSKQSTVTGLVLLDNAIAAKDYELAVKLAVAVAEDGTNSAQALQARRLLNKMTPSGKLYAVTQVADRIAAAQRKRIGEAKIDREAGKIENATEEVKQTVAENFKARAQRRSNKTIEGNQAGEPFWFEYETEVGKAIADAVKKRITPRPKKQQPFMRTVIRNLTAFANQLTPKAVVNPKMTATERIADYLANKEFYDNAWANAQEELMQRYEGDEEMLDALDEFTSSLTTMTTPTGTQTMIKALAESAFDQYLDAKTLAIQNSLNIDGAANAIAQRLVSEIERISGIKVDEETALSIRLAADDYVQDAIAEADPNSLVSAQIKDVLRNLDVKLAEVATSSRVDKAAVGTAVIDTLTKRWGFSEADALNVAEVVQSQFTDMVTETMERKLKQIYGEKKEREVKSMTQLFAESVNLGAFDSGEYAQKAAERFFGADIQIDPELAREYVEALEDGTDEDIADALKALQQNIAGQIPVSWVDKLNAWRYLAMLGNPRTHIRNTFGNAFFAIPVMVKNVFSTGIEAGVDKLSKNGIQRTKAVINPAAKQDRALLATAWLDYANASEQILAGGKYDDIFSGVSDKQTIFQFKPLEAVRKFNSKALDKEDAWFAQPHYATALAGYLKANGISAVEFTNGSISEAAMNEARNYAVKEAQKATFRDINTFSEMVSKIGKSDNKVVNAAASAVLPFKKTPANILVRGVEYSPIGLVKGLVDIRNIKTPNNPNGTKTAAEVIDELAAGLTGTGLVALGALLVRSGVLTGGGGDDDKENKFQSMQGRQNYALVLPDGTTVTLDWLAPEVLPVFVGAELYNSLSGNGNSWENILAAISTIPQPMLDMSLLQSVNDLIDNAAYAKKGKGIYKIIAGMATSLLSQFVPTIFGQVERTTETKRQQTFIDRSDGAPSSAVQSFWARLNDKNPFYDYNKIPYIDAWGRTEETGTFAERFANNFFNPAYVKEASGTPIDSELQRLYELGNTSVYPTKPGTDVKINGEYLSAEEYVEYAKKRGSESLENVRELINSSAYKNMSDADKADAIKAVYDYADDIAKQYVRRGAKISSWVEKATASGNPSQYITDTIIMRTADTDGNGNFSNAEKVRGLIDGGYSGEELVEKVREYMTTENGNCRLGDMLERAQSVKVPDTVTLNVYEFYNNANSKDASGNTVSGLKKERVQQYINSLSSLTAEQKDALYYSLYKK